MFNFEWTIRAGDVGTMITFLGASASFLYRRGGSDIAIKMTLKALTDQLSEMKTEFKSFGETIKEVSVQKTQIALLMKWYDELRRGVGKIEE